jgi:hypothetical protein
VEAVEELLRSRLFGPGAEDVVLLARIEDLPGFAEYRYVSEGGAA